MANPSKKAKSRYKTFTGREGEKPSVRTLKAPGELVCIARPEFLTYYSSKLNGGGDGTLQKFRHRFGASIKLYTDPEGTFLLIAGPGLRITRRGIVG